MWDHVPLFLKQRKICVSCVLESCEISIHIDSIIMVNMPSVNRPVYSSSVFPTQISHWYQVGMVLIRPAQTAEYFLLSTILAERINNGDSYIAVTLYQELL